MKYTKEWVIKNSKVQDKSNNSLFFWGRPMVTVFTDEEEEAVLNDIYVALNNPQKWNADNEFDAVSNVKESYRNRKKFKEQKLSYYDSKLEQLKKCQFLYYNNSAAIGALTLGKYEEDIFLDYGPEDIANACMEFQRGTNLEIIIRKHFNIGEDPEILVDDLKLMYYAWEHDKLNKFLEVLSDFSFSEDGYIDYRNGGISIFNIYYDKCCHK